MANIFVDDGGSNTAPHETWAKAATTFLVGVDAAAAGDDIIIGHDHSEAPGAQTYVFPGTPTSISRVISATSTAGGSVITYNKADNVQVASTSDITFRGHVHFYGVSFSVADDIFIQTSVTYILFDDATLLLTGTNSNFRLGSAAGQIEVTFKNTDINFTGGGTTVGFLPNGPTVINWFGGTQSWSLTQPTALFNANDENQLWTFHGVDFSAITTGLVDISDNSDIKVTFAQCLINSGASITIGTVQAQGTRILASGTDDSTGNKLYRLDYLDYWGSTVHDDVIFRDDGASDGNNNISWKMVSTANAVEFSEPTKSPPIYSWVDTSGSTTFTVSVNWDSASDLQDDEVWLEIEFLEASADTDSAFSDDRMTDISSTPVDQANNSEVWTGTSGFTNENTQEVAVTATVNRVGPVIARVCLAKPSTTIYVDPLIVKS